MSRVAVIDIGTNTSKIHIAEINGQGFKSIRKAKMPSKLGMGGTESMLIQPEAIERLKDALSFFKSICIEENCSDVIALATAMMRNSKNGKEVVETIFKETGIAIQIINGEEEADLIFKGVSSCVEANIGQYLIMDIGGGSTEFILVNDGRPTWQNSFQFGATTLLEKFNVSDPISLDQIAAIEHFLESELRALWDNCKGINIPLVGSSGSFESISEMIAHRNETIHHFKFGESNVNSIEDLLALNDSIIKSTRIERSRMRGLPEFRIDTIVTALVTLKFVSSKIHFSSIVTAPFSLKEGAIMKYFVGGEVSS